MQNLQDLFQELNTKDPKIKISENNIYISPNYWNVSFITTFIPILGVLYIYAFLNIGDGIINFWILIIVVTFPIIIIMQLKYYNTVIINSSDKTVSVIPNVMLRPFVNKKIFPFQDVKKFESTSNEDLDGARLTYRRYIIVLALKNSDKIKLLSTKESTTAAELAKLLSSIIK